MKQRGIRAMLDDLVRLYNERKEIRLLARSVGHCERNLVEAVRSMAEQIHSDQRRLTALDAMITHETLSRDNKAKDAQPPTVAAH
jgi:hypothetical protein